MKKLAIITFASIMLASCTENEMAKNFGGSMTVNLPQGQKLVNITWKENELWYLSKPMSSTDSAETYTFQEKSSYGIQEGTITLKESK
jgi:hypothetical protein